MDQKTARSWPVRDDAVGSNAEHAVRHLLVGCDPAVRVPPPPELGKHTLEPLGKRRQHDFGIEVADSDLWVVVHHSIRSRLFGSV